MCLMCIEIAKGRMTIPEGRKALRELMSSDQKVEDLEHYKELSSLDDQEFKEKVEETNK